MLETTKGSKPLHLSKQEAIKNIRDNSIATLGTLLPIILETLQVTDFGDKTPLIALVCTIISQWVYRITRDSSKTV
jgi:hypothetical protein